MQEAILFKKLEDGKVQCRACNHYCTIAPNNTGICGVRQNKEGKLYLLVYGKASAAHVDPVEKKPLFHFLPGTRIFSIGTVGCNFACSFCQNWDISQVTKGLKLRLLKEKKLEMMDVAVSRFGYELPPHRIVKICLDLGITSIAYTYNEPVIFFEYLYDTAKLAAKEKIKNVFVSNGYESNESLNLIKPYLNAINIDLKAFTHEFYQKLCKAKLEPVLENIKKVHELGIWVEITTLVIPGHNDSDEELNKIANFILGIDRNIPWHVTAFHPDYKMKDVHSTSTDSLIRAYEIGKKAGLNFVYVGNIIDEERSSTYCPKCNTLLIRRNGYIVKVENMSKGKCKECGKSIPGVWK